MAITGLPFDDLRSLLRRLPEPDEEAAASVRSAVRGEDTGTLGRLEDLAVWLARWSGRRPPRITRPLVALFAGTHGVSHRLWQNDAARRTKERVERIATGSAPISLVCAANDLGLKVFDLALDIPTGDIVEQAAFEERDCAATVAFGMEAIAGGTDLLCIGEVGTEGEVAAAAVLATLSGKDVAGLDGERQRAVERALATHRGHLADPLEALRRLGSREIAAAAGAILAARMEKIPVILEGLTPMSAAAALESAHRGAAAHCLLAATHDARQRAVAEWLNLPGFPDFGIEAGEGAAAAFAAGCARTAARLAGEQPHSKLSDSR